VIVSFHKILYDVVIVSSTYHGFTIIPNYRPALLAVYRYISYRWPIWRFQILVGPTKPNMIYRYTDIATEQSWWSHIYPLLIFIVLLTANAMRSHRNIHTETQLETTRIQAIEIQSNADLSWWEQTLRYLWVPHYLGWPRHHRHSSTISILNWLLSARDVKVSYFSSI